MNGSDEERFVRDFTGGSEYAPTREADEARLRATELRGRCGKCGSKNLWSDAAAYGCLDCGDLVLLVSPSST